MPLTAFEIDDQRFVSVATERRTSDNGRWYRISIWQTACPDCGTVFTQIHRNSTFRPAQDTTRRCPPCRKPGVNVPRKTPQRSAADCMPPAKWTQAGSDFRQTNLTHGNEQDEPRTVTITPELLASQSSKWPRKPAKGGFIDR